MTPGNTFIIIAMSIAWIYLRLKDKSLGAGAYAPGQPYSRMSDAIALFGLFWLSFIPVGIFATVALMFVAENLLLLSIVAGTVIGMLYMAFKTTRLAPKAPFLDNLRSVSFGSKAREKGESIVPVSSKEKLPW